MCYGHGPMQSATASPRKRAWQRPGITFEMPFRNTQSLNGCAADGGTNPATSNTFTPVVKTGAATDTIYPSCVASS
jgi:hypothetical protein